MEINLFRRETGCGMCETSQKRWQLNRKRKEFLILYQIFCVNQIATDGDMGMAFAKCINCYDGGFGEEGGELSMETEDDFNDSYTRHIFFYYFCILIISASND